MINNLVLSGTLASEPKVTHVGDNNTQLVTVPVAFESKGYSKTKGEFILNHRLTIKFWGKRGDAFKNLPEGTELLIQGQLKEERWKDKEGEWKGMFVCVPDHVHLLGKNPQELEANEEAPKSGAEEEIPF